LYSFPHATVGSGCTQCNNIVRSDATPKWVMFNYGQDAPKKPLAVLDELWNIDKHRHLHLTLFFVGLHDVESKRPEIKFRILKKKPPGPFKGRAETGRVEPVGGPYRNWVMAHVNMKPILTFDIAFKQGPPAHGGRVMETLSEIRDHVADILHLFDALSRTRVPHT